MRFLLFALSANLLFSSVNAQYKKAASAFGGSGVTQTFNLGISTQVTPNYYSKAPLSFHITMGADKEESRWFQTATIRIQLPTDFVVKTKAYSYSADKTTDVTLKAKTTVAGFLDYDWGVYFNDANENEKLRPFVVFGFGFHMGGFKNNSDNEDQILNDTQSDIIYATVREPNAFGGNVKAGLGVVYMFNEKIGVKADALYHYIPDIKNWSAEDGIKYYNAINGGVVLNLRLHMKLGIRG
jgi:hypothetical protein